jgi:hypothetical protein
MKVPVGPYGTFTTADWKEIKQSLAKIGVNLDEASISADFEWKSKGRSVYRYSSDKCRWLSHGPEWRLNHALQQIAYFYTLPIPPTAKRRRAELEQTLTAVEKARKRLRSTEAKRLHNYPDVRRSITKDGELDDLIVWKMTDLQEQIAALRAIGSGRGQSALKPQSRYWRELTELWRACREGRRLHERALRQFLLACSRTPFAKMSTETLEDEIDNFLSNLSHSRKRRS